MGDNPKWQKILDALPEVLHPTIKPILQEWDQGVNQMLQERDSKYEPYKAFIEQGIHPDYLNQSLQVAELIRTNPDQVIERINEAHNLGYLSKTQAEQLTQQVESDDDEDYNLNSDNIESHPKFRALLEQVGNIETNLTAQQQRERELSEQQEFDTYITGLHERLGEFDDEIVMAYMAYGDLDGPAAVDKYRTRIASLIPNAQNEQQQEQVQSSNGDDTPPLVLDGNPAGSGSEQQTIDFASMKKSDTNKMVAEMLARAAADDQ